MCVSASQFSKLISGAATESMYTRSIRNIERLEREQQALREREAAVAKGETAAGQLRRLSKRARRRLVLFSLLALVLVRLDRNNTAYFTLRSLGLLELLRLIIFETLH